MERLQIYGSFSSGLLVAGAAITLPLALHADVGGLHGPLFGLEAAPNGDLLVADASTGIIQIRDDEVRQSLDLVGATDVSLIGTRAAWIVTGAQGEPPVAGQTDTGQALHRLTPRGVQLIANLFEFEAANDPDAPEPPTSDHPPDSNPFDVQAVDGTALVVDAGGNDLLWIDLAGVIRVLAVFPSELVPTANLKSLAGCPGSAVEFCALPEQLPAQAVPTSVAIGPDGNFYVGELKGFPAPVGESNIWRVAPGAAAAECGVSPDCVKVFDGGFTSVIDLAFAPDGTLYVAEMDEESWAAVEIFASFSGGTISRCDVAAEVPVCTEVATGIPQLTAIALDRDGTLWATRNALVPGGAEVVMIPQSP